MKTANGDFYNMSQRGASILEVLLVFAIIAIISPFLYIQISNVSSEIGDIQMAKKIVAVSGQAKNFVRTHMSGLEENVQIELTAKELEQISDMPHIGFIDKYTSGMDIYLVYHLSDNALRTARIKRHLGMDAAIVGSDNVAYGDNWSVAAPGLESGDLMQRIKFNSSPDERSRYLHRTSFGDSELNKMMRPLNMAGFALHDVGTITSESAKARNITASFLESKTLRATDVLFTSGATMDATDIEMGTVNVKGDLTGFRNITAKNLNGAGFATSGGIIADRARINNSLTVGRDMNIKSDSVRTLSLFTMISAHSASVPFLTAEEIDFYNNFGLTISGELLMSSTPPLKIGNWVFPSQNPPRFSELKLGRGTITVTPSKKEFEQIMSSDWKSIK